MPKTSEHPVPNIFQNLLAKILPSPVGSSNITLISSSSNFFDPLIQRKAPGVRPNHLAICPLGRCSHAESESEVKTIRFHSWKQASGPSRIFCLFKLQYVRVLILLVVVVESHYFFNDNYCWLPSTASPPFSPARRYTFQQKQLQNPSKTWTLQRGPFVVVVVFFCCFSYKDSHDSPLKRNAFKCVCVCVFSP